jgi:hypothetical protein
MKIGRNRNDAAAGRHAVEYAEAEPENPAASPAPTSDPDPGASSSCTGQTLFGTPLDTAEPGRLGLPDAGPTKPWLAKPAAVEAATAGSAPSDTAASAAAEPADSPAAAPPRTQGRRRAPSEPGTVLKFLAADISRSAPEPPPIPVQKQSVARTRPAPMPAPRATEPAPAKLDVATVVDAERRLDELSRRLNDVELHAEAERQSTLHRLAETEQLLDAAEARAAAADQRVVELEQELDAAVGLLAEYDSRRDELEQQVKDQANHRQLLERAQGALTAESQARTLLESQLAEASRAAETLQAHQAAEISRLNIALQAAVDRRVEFEARIAEMEAGARAQREAEARSWVSAEQRLTETIAALESERTRGEQWRREAATEVQQQLHEALGALSAPAGRHADAASTESAVRPRPRPEQH